MCGCALRVNESIVTDLREGASGAEHQLPEDPFQANHGYSPSMDQSVSDGLKGRMMEGPIHGIKKTRASIQR